MTSNRSLETKEQIIRAALTLLKESGVEGLTMRKVASTSGRSLNNVQHHFKNKGLLLKGMAAYYFEVCDNLINQYESNKVEKEPKAELYDVILFSLDYASQLSDACLVFRELWAVSTRNDAVQEQLNEYYSISLQRLCDFWCQYDSENAKKAAAILLPYIDGYSIQHKALPFTKEQISEILTESLYMILSNKIKLTG